ncbi:MAG: TrmH family RNA methyltransferase [Patescibacteria group bacterium]|jgi:tRNA G18 (ribose-2'-O)-methylase SpoU|nr:TrmH family RNA methyltransferase [Patescibacteria group bacterium]
MLNSQFKLRPKTLRNSVPLASTIKNIKRQPIYFILDNVLDTYNVGSIFRLADAVSASRVYLCGETETPPNTKIKKASINTWQWTDWRYKPDVLAAIDELRQEIKGIKIISVEQNEQSQLYHQAKYPLPLALIVGNETRGVSEVAIAKSDFLVELPMFGVNSSLNVIVSLAVVAYEVLEKNKIK